MEKISLEELTARSKKCGYSPQLIEIARSAKSPTAAFTMSASFGNDVATACRYLAMIMRDYGRDAFEEVAGEVTKSVTAETEFIFLRPFLQIASRFSYILAQLRSQNANSFRFSESDIGYIKPIKWFFKVFENYGRSQKMMDTLKFSEEKDVKRFVFYLNEARILVECIENNQFVDLYSIEKTLIMLNIYITAIGKRAGIPDYAFSVIKDAVFSFLE